MRGLRTWFPVGFLLLLVVAAVAGPRLAPYDPTWFDRDAVLSGPSAHHLLGTDQMGRDILSRLIYGARASMEVAVGGTSLAAALGVALGLLGAYFGGAVELVTLRVADVILAFPPIVLALLVVTLTGPGVTTLIYVIGFLYIPTFARVTYGEVLSIRRMEYVQALRALGAGHVRIMLDAILPNAMPPVLVQYSLSVAAAILLESGLSFLGLGVVPPTPSWGSMIGDARAVVLQSPVTMLWPCVTIVATILAVNMLGDVVRDRLDPRLWGSRAPVEEPAVAVAAAEPVAARPAREGASK